VVPRKLKPFVLFWTEGFFIFKEFMMSLSKRYNPRTSEPELEKLWQETAVYHFQPDDEERPLYSIDTPPATVSGHLHLGHVYSYSQTDFIARFWRMNGYNVYYPMGFDDNGLPTERLVERTEKIKAREMERSAFIEKCLATSEEAEKAYQALWQRLGLSIDWRYSYRTIDEHSRRLAQLSFIDLYKKGLIYRQKAPTLWCPECQTAIAQADLEDMERQSTFHSLAFRLEDGSTLPIATTRPELLAACVAVFVHPEDGRYQHLHQQIVTVPLFGQQVPLLPDPAADPEKGTGAVMCCTFGDQTDVAWWYTHKLPLIEAIGKNGRLTQAAAPYTDLTIEEARQQIIQNLSDQELLLEQKPTDQAVRIHERCDTPVEFIVTEQWFVRILENKDTFLALGDQIEWQPTHMKSRYMQWVENLSWDWCISRQRFFGVTFPLWTCADCGETILADEADLPIDPTEQQPKRPCLCGSTQFIPENDVMDTWATSSLTPQIVGQWHKNDNLYNKVAPYSLRPQAHEIIRTWAFYTIVKSHYHFNQLPWHTVAISGWGLAPEGSGKISKSRGGGPMPPMEMIAQYSADAVRYWAASTGLGKDAIINEEKIQAGAKLINKLWNVSRFSQRFLEDYQPRMPDNLSPADRWILARLQQLIQRATKLMEQYDYATAKSEIEVFFWRDLADNYLELAKKRLYDGGNEAAGARYALYQSVLSTLKLLAPFLPFVTEKIYTGLFSSTDGQSSIHIAQWPQINEMLVDETAVSHGELLVDIATAVRRYKSEHNFSLGAELDNINIISNGTLTAFFQAAETDLLSITRARTISVTENENQGHETIDVNNVCRLTITHQA
jgi:valyl-tRNA synthetase